MNKSFFLLTICLLASGTTFSQEQTSAADFQRAERLRSEYNFEEAVKIYRRLLENTKDEKFATTLNIQIARCENGIGMLEFSASPAPMGHSDVPKRDFTGFIPKQGESYWATLPAILGKTRASESPQNLVFVNPELDVIYFSALSERGNYNIYKTTRINDTLWHAPEPLDDIINSSGDEILPVISRDGKELFYASNGQYGVGGFDIFHTRMDEKSGKWEIPQNMGFPYSTPFDDYLFINDYDKRYSYLVSNRSIASSDTVRVYRLAYEVNPVKRSITNPKEAFAISRLMTEAPEERISQPKQDVPDTGDYPALVREVRKIQQQIDSTLRSLAGQRDRFSKMENIDERLLIEREITSGEIDVSQLREKLSMATKAVQQKEMEFLSKGILIPRREVTEERPREPAVEKDPFVTYRITPGRLDIRNLFEPEKPIDYSFRIGRESEIFEETPDAGLIYRIQLAVVTSKASPSTFKGISPIFEAKTPTGKWLYTAGNFRRYAEASDALQKAKGKGFRTAMVVAYKNGKSINVKNARLEEDKIAEHTNYHVKISGYPDELPASVIATIRATTDRDIARRLSSAGKSEYFIGPFSTKEEAEAVERVLNTVGTNGVSVEEITKSK